MRGGNEGQGRLRGGWTKIKRLGGAEGESCERKGTGGNEGSLHLGRKKSILKRYVWFIKRKKDCEVCKRTGAAGKVDAFRVATNTVKHRHQPPGTLKLEIKFFINDKAEKREEKQFIKG